MGRRRRQDPKLAALRDSRTLNPRPEGVTDEQFASSEFFDARDLVQVKYEMVRMVRQRQASITCAASAFGFSRQSYYDVAKALDAGGLAGLVPSKPGPKGGHKLTAEVLAWAREQLAADPGLRPAKLAGPIQERFGVRVHPRSVERALARYRDDSKSPG